MKLHQLFVTEAEASSSKWVVIDLEGDDKDGELVKGVWSFPFSGSAADAKRLESAIRSDASDIQAGLEQAAKELAIDGMEFIGAAMFNGVQDKPEGTKSSEDISISWLERNGDFKIPA